MRTLVLGLPSWIEEVGSDYVVMRPERTGTQCKITKVSIESRLAPGSRVIAAMQLLGGYQ